MSNILTDEQCKLVDNIPTSEIEKDIKDTEVELDRYQREYDILMEAPSEHKLSIIVARVNIDKRKVFIDKLNCILDYRKRNTIVS